MQVYPYQDHSGVVRSPSTASTLEVTPPEIMSPEAESMLTTPPPMLDPTTKAPFNLKFPILQRQPNIPNRVYLPSRPTSTTTVTPPPFDATYYSPPSGRTFFSTSTPKIAATSIDLMSQIDFAAEKDWIVKKTHPGPTDEEILNDNEEEPVSFWTPMLNFFMGSEIGKLLLGSTVTTTLLTTLRISSDYLLTHYSLPPWLRKGLRMIVNFIPPNLTALFTFLRKRFNYNPGPQVDKNFLT